MTPAASRRACHPCGQSTAIWKPTEIFGLADPLHTGRLRDAGLRVLRGHDHARWPACRPGQRPGNARRDRHGRPAERIRRQVDSFETGPSIAGLNGGLYHGVFIRAPRAERVSEDAEVLAAEPRTGKVVAVRQGPALATGFHPSR
jgi:pyridoxal 5'-phosphate synthase pdxT subunit